MKVLTEHPSSVILAVVAIVLIVGIVLCFTTPIGQFFGNIFTKTNEPAMGDIGDYGAYEPNGFGGGSNTLAAGLYDAGGSLLADWTTLGADISKDYDSSSCKTDSSSLYFKLSSTSAYDAGTTLVIPEGTTTIGEWAFSHNENITTVVIPDSVTTIAYSAFYGCTNLSSVTFGENSQLTRIEQNAFSSCTSLTSIEIPDSVTYIGDLAFSDTGFTSITIPEGLTYLGDSAFSGCEDLVSAVLPEDIRGISYGVFNNCTSLTSITFEGTVEQWNAITLGNIWNRNVPATYVQCNDGAVTLS